MPDFPNDFQDPLLRILQYVSLSPKLSLCTVSKSWREMMLRFLKDDATVVRCKSRSRKRKRDEPPLFPADQVLKYFTLSNIKDLSLCGMSTPEELNLTGKITPLRLRLDRPLTTRAWLDLSLVQRYHGPSAQIGTLKNCEVLHLTDYFCYARVAPLIAKSMPNVRRICGNFRYQQLSKEIFTDLIKSCKQLREMESLNRDLIDEICDWGLGLGLGPEYKFTFVALSINTTTINLPATNKMTIIIRHECEKSTFNIDR